MFRNVALDLVTQNNRYCFTLEDLIYFIIFILDRSLYQIKIDQRFQSSTYKTMGANIIKK